MGTTLFAIFDSVVHFSKVFFGDDGGRDYSEGDGDGWNIFKGMVVLVKGDSRKGRSNCLILQHSAPLTAVERNSRQGDSGGET